MTVIVGLTKLKNLHKACECVIIADIEDTAEPTKLQKDACDIKVENLVIAFDCDSCEGFTSEDLRPDIISIRRCDTKYEWLLLEMKKKMRQHAATQASAALERLGRDPLFSVELKDAHIFFVIKNRRKTDNTIMRKIKTIEAGQWKVVPRLIESGQTILCNKHTKRTPN